MHPELDFFSIYDLKFSVGETDNAGEYFIIIYEDNDDIKLKINLRKDQIKDLCEECIREL